MTSYQGLIELAYIVMPLFVLQWLLPPDGRNRRP